MKSPELIRRIVDLATGDPPVLVSVTDDATPEDIDEALCLIAADRAALPGNERSQHVPA